VIYQWIVVAFDNAVYQFENDLANSLNYGNIIDNCCKQSLFEKTSKGLPIIKLKMPVIVLFPMQIC